jgi:cytochrome P450
LRLTRNSIAGSETTATALACITYHLLKFPEIGLRLQTEIREAFNSYQEIDGTSTTSLLYLNAVILEAMRVYPPLPFPLPRVVPQGGDIVDGHFIPEGVSELDIVGAAIFLGILANYKVPQTIVSTNPFAASMSSQNFLNPWKFDPEDTLGASQPFSLGTRSCLGKRYVASFLTLHLAFDH